MMKETRISPLLYAPANSPRPRTADLFPLECERLNLLTMLKSNEDSIAQSRHPKTFAKKSAESTEALKKRVKSPSPSKPVYSTPGCTLLRSKTKMNMILHDDLFNPNNEVKPDQKPCEPDPEIVEMAERLKTQVADLSLFLEEERLMHKETRRKAAEYLKDTIDMMKRDHKEALRRLHEEHRAEMDAAKTRHHSELSNSQQESAKTIAKLKTEAEFMSYAFHTYKTQTEADNKEASKQREAKLIEEITHKHEDEMRKLKDGLMSSYEAKESYRAKEHGDVMAALRREFNRKMEAVNNRYADHESDLLLLRDTQLKVQALEKELTNKDAALDLYKKRLNTTKNNYDDSRMRLNVIENDLNSRMSEVDLKYQSELDKLKEENAKLKMQYMKKCEDLFDVMAKQHGEECAKAINNRDLMQTLIGIRQQAEISIAAYHKDPMISSIQSTQYKSRILSAPVSGREVSAAYLTLGNTEEKETPTRGEYTGLRHAIIETSTIT